MKRWRNLFAVILVFALLAAACSPAAGPAPGQDAPAPGAQATPATPTADGDDDDDDDAPILSDIDEAEEIEFGVRPAALPRNETMFFGGLQSVRVLSSNPFSTNPNNGMMVVQGTAGSRPTVYESLFMFNALNGDFVPLLAYGPHEWNADMTVITVRMNPHAFFHDGSAVTAHDVVNTFDAHIRVSSPLGLEYAPFFDRVVATDDLTVEFHANTANHNPLKMQEWLPRVYILPTNFLDAKFEEHGSDYEAFRNDTWHGAPGSGPYRPLVITSQQIVLERDDSHWGQHPSMWGALPVPRYLVHNIFSGNAAITAALVAGQIDMCQSFHPGVWEFWENDGLPISTFLDGPPYYMPGQMPSLWFNGLRPGLDQLAVRRAIAYAIDYEQIVAAAMSGFSPTFEEAPRSIANPMGGEQRFVDNAALAHLQWPNRDIARANQVLDEAGFVDTTGNGIREFNGEDLSFTLMCPRGWTDWEAALEIVAAAGAEIGINLTTTFLDAAVVTENRQTGNFDIIMAGTQADGPAQPWSRANHIFSVENPEADRLFWGYHRMVFPRAIELLDLIAAETDVNRLIAYYTEISEILLTYHPIVYLMYRPTMFHTVNEIVWTGFPEYGDGSNIPPTSAVQGYGFRALYNVRLVN